MVSASSNVMPPTSKTLIKFVRHVILLVVHARERESINVSHVMKVTYSMESHAYPDAKMVTT